MEGAATQAAEPAMSLASVPEPAAAAALLPPPSQEGVGGSWYSVDPGGAVKLRTGPSMDYLSPCILNEGDLVYAHSELAKWVQNEEGLWVPKSFLVPLDPEKLAAAKAAHKHKREQLAAAGPGGSAEPGWYRVDDDGSVVFRRSPVYDDRTSLLARERELIFIARCGGLRDCVPAIFGLSLSAPLLEPCCYAAAPRSPHGLLRVSAELPAHRGFVCAGC
eukprot:COSAG01_NODE_22296_length_862_cov_0.782438_1_plen_218_part_01